MLTTTFTKTQAETIARKYQMLVGRLFDKDHDWLVDCVIVSPADKLNQWLLAHVFMDSGSTIDPTFYHDHTEFDVLLVSVCDRANEKVVYKTINDYLEENGERLNSNVYELRYAQNGAARLKQVD